MIKKKISSREIRKSYSNILCVGYCGIKYLT